MTKPTPEQIKRAEADKPEDTATNTGAALVIGWLLVGGFWVALVAVSLVVAWMAWH